MGSFFIKSAGHNFQAMFMGLKTFIVNVQMQVLVDSKIPFNVYFFDEGTLFGFYTKIQHFSIPQLYDNFVKMHMDL